MSALPNSPAYREVKRRYNDWTVCGRTQFDFSEHSTFRSIIVSCLHMLFLLGDEAVLYKLQPNQELTSITRQVCTSLFNL